MNLPEYLKKHADELRAIRSRQPHLTTEESALQIERVKMRIKIIIDTDEGSREDTEAIGFIVDDKEEDSSPEASKRQKRQAASG